MGSLETMFKTSITNLSLEKSCLVKIKVKSHHFSHFRQGFNVVQYNTGAHLNLITSPELLASQIL